MSDLQPFTRGQILGVLALHSAFFALFFAPAWLTGRELAREDSVAYHYPAYHSPRDLWEPGLMGGFPRFADPQFQMWYPPAVLLAAIGAPFTVHVILAYALAAAFTHLLVLRLTGSWLAGAVAGLVFATGGFLTGHGAHTAVIHAAAWLPLQLWVLEELRCRVTAVGVVVLAVSGACCVLAGHTQVSFLVLLLAAAYGAMLLPGAPAGPWRFGAAGLGAVLLGLALTAVQVVPTAELAGLSDRRHRDFGFFCSYHLPLAQWPRLLFPYAYGLFWFPGVDRVPELGAAHASHEWLGSVGFVALLTGTAAVLAGRRDRRVWFWLAVLAFAFLAALGDEGPLARLLFKVPVLNRFRCPGRFLLYYGFGLAVLAGFGIHALARLPRRRALGVALGGVGITLALAGGALLTFRAQLGGAAFSPDLANWVPPDSRFLSARPWVNPALGLPFAGLILSTLALLTHLVWRGRLGAAALLAATALDGGAIGWLHLWQTESTPVAGLRPTPALDGVRAACAANHTRCLHPDRAQPAPYGRPNFNLVQRLPEANVYGPLVPARLGQLAPHAALSARLLSVQFWISPVVPGPHGVFAPEPLAAFSVGGPAVAWAPPERRLPAPAGDITGFSLTGHLGYSPAIPDGAPVVEVCLIGECGETLGRTQLLAGRDLAEGAWDRPDVAASARHRRAAVFRSWPMTDGLGNSHPGHDYVTHRAFEGPGRAREVVVRWVGPPYAVCQVSHLTLHGADGARYLYLAHAGHIPQGPAVALPGSDLHVATNPTPAPRARLVPAAIVVPPDRALATLTAADAPDPSRFVVLEEAPGRLEYPPDASAAVEWLADAPERVALRTRSAQGAFLVLGDAWYPGWVVTIDGLPARLMQADHVVRAVEVPPGEHVVEFVFRPRSFQLGAAISLAALVLTVALPWVGWRSRS